MERLAVLRAGLLLAWDYGPVRCSSAYVFHDTRTADMAFSLNLPGPFGP